MQEISSRITVVVDYSAPRLQSECETRRSVRSSSRPLLPDSGTDLICVSDFLWATTQPDHCIFFRRVASQTLGRYHITMSEASDETPLLSRGLGSPSLATYRSDDPEEQRQSSSRVRPKVANRMSSSVPVPGKPHVEKHMGQYDSIMRDVIIGFSDGLTVPFALTAGLSSLGDTKLVIMGGLAELCSGMISMGLGAYLAADTERQHWYVSLGPPLSRSTQS